MTDTGIPRDKLTGALRRSSVKKHVAAIHVSGKLTLLQRKLSNVLLLNAYDTLTTRNTHEIDARTLCLMIGYNSNDIETLKQALRGLAETVAEWNILDEAGGEEWGVSSLLAYAKLKGGVCEYAYSAALAEKLHDPSVFALINLDIQRRFTSGHALALYENCYRFVRTGSTGWWPIDLFRRLMGVNDSAYYESFKHLNAKIIKPAVAEVNKTSNIVVTPEFKKAGRQVREIRFLIGENPQLAMLDLDDGAGVRKSPVYAKLAALGVSDRLARQWIAQHGEAYVDEKLALLAEQRTLRNPVGYLSAALKNDYGAAKQAAPAPPSADAVEKAAARQAEAARQAAADAARASDARTRAAQMRQVQRLAEARTPTQRDADRRLFLARLSDETERAAFAQHGWAAALCLGHMVAFWDELIPGAFDDVAP